MSYILKVKGSNKLLLIASNIFWTLNNNLTLGSRIIVAPNNMGVSF